MFKKLLLSGFSLVLIAATAQAQEKDKIPFKERLVYGGDVILSIGNNQTAIGASPLVGYKVSPRYIAGLGYTYVYYESGSFQSRYYGPRIFNRFFPIEQGFLHAEFEHLTFKQELELSSGENIEEKRSFPALLVGGGYRQELAPRVFFSISVLYDVIEDEDSFYNGPIIRAGVGVGF